MEIGNRVKIVNLHYFGICSRYGYLTDFLGKTGKITKISKHEDYTIAYKIKFDDPNIKGEKSFLENEITLDK